MINSTVLNGKDTCYIAQEITSQPNLWKETYSSVLNNKSKILCFLNRVFQIDNLQIILTGAGTSAFIGEILQQSFIKNTGLPTKAISTTDIVTHPADFFQKTIPTLLISFARSGDSPESLATVELAEKLQNVIYHLVITCNPEGALTRAALNTKNSFIFLLPEGTNDLALTMTSSFTSMTLAGLLISDIKNIDKNGEKVKQLIDYGQIILDQYATKLQKAADLDFERIVFLGSGPLKGVAKEAQLKVIELTDGQIICQHDSFFGFRHGPRAAINGATMLIYLFSNDPYVFKYEIDLVKSINQTENFIFSIGIGQCLDDLGDLSLNLKIDFSLEGTKIPNDYFSICSIIPAQMLGYYKSLELGLKPDSPSINGGIHRVVQGVTIYPY